MKKEIYADYAASTPVDKEVLKAMMPYLKEEYGNPSSTHSFGQRTRAAIEQAREQVAQFLGCKADEIVFTGGATEANNVAIQGILKKYSGKRPHIVTTAIEHESVLDLCKALEKEGAVEVTYVKPQKDGIVNAVDVLEAIQENTVLVSVMYANSEIGTIQPVQEIGRKIQELKSNTKSVYPVFHIDAVQAAGFLDCNIEHLFCSLLTLSGHKIYGPKGVGVLYKKEGTLLGPVSEGGGQEMGIRSGTENVAGIVGMGAALELCSKKNQNERIKDLRNKLITRVQEEISDTQVTGSLETRLPNNAHFRFLGAEGKDIVILLDQKGIAVSTGSACSEKTQEASHVLLALDLQESDALSSIRVTLGRGTNAKEVEKIVQALKASVFQLRKTKV